MLFVLEAAVGIEPTHGGFAVPSVPTSPHGRFVTLRLKTEKSYRAIQNIRQHSIFKKF